VASVGTEADAEKEMWPKLELKLGAQYRYDFDGPESLDIQGSIAPSDDCGRTLPPIFVVHGSADRCVPLAEGEALFAAAGGEKEFFVIKKGGHLLNSSGHMKKFVNAMAKRIAAALPSSK
jgi:fermentation-respiration switch protein FrsA (DUF1100 family)